MNTVNRVKALRVSQGVSQRELAERIGMKAPNLARIESGRVDPSVSVVERIAEALGARVEVVDWPGKVNG